MARSTTKADTAPSPDDPRKPDSPDDLSKPTTGYIVKRAVREFSKDQCTDLAAALTYYAVLALAPGLLAIVSLLGLFGQNEAVLQGMRQIVADLVPEDAAESFVTPLLNNVAGASGVSIGVIIGLAGALWSASGYVGAFSRAMNRIYEIDEGRPVWKLRPTTLGVTLVAVAVIGIGLVIVVASGPVAQSIGDAVGLGSTAVTVWNIVKWPVLLLLVVLVVALLYYATPNVKQPKFRWMSLGALFAIVVWIIASLAFGFYVANFSSYSSTYGALAGVIIGLLWLWITNLVLLFGAEIDAEVERGRQLQAGIRAEETVQLPPRDTRGSEKKQQKEQKDVDDGYVLRLRNGGESREDQERREAAEQQQQG